jgi:hypothetical protein
VRDAREAAITAAQGAATRDLGSEGERELARRYVAADGRVQVKGAYLDDRRPAKPGLIDDIPTCDVQRDLQRAAFAKKVVALASTRGGPVPTPEIDAEIRHLVGLLPEAIRAPIQKTFTDASTYGAEWIPDVVPGYLEMGLRDARVLANEFTRVQMPAKEWRPPFLTTGLTPYLKGSAGSSDDPAKYRASSLATTNLTVTATGFAVRALIDEDAAEDSVIPAMPLLEQEEMAALIDGEEDALCNADTAATHQDSIATPWNPRSRWAGSMGGSDDHRRAWIGLRARAFDVSNTTDQGSAQTYAGLLALRSTLAAPHGRSGRLILLTSIEVYCQKLLGLAEVITVDKYGPNATVLSGEVASIGGMKIIVSDFMTSDLAATGLYTGSGAKSSWVIANLDRFWIGERRGIRVESQKDVNSGVTAIVTTRREAFATRDSASHKNVALGYNLL